MPITANHPSVVRFDRTRAYLVDPDWAADSAGEHSMDTLRATARSRTPLTLTGLALVGVGIAVMVMFRDVIVDALPISGRGAETLVSLGIAVVVAVLLIPVVRGSNKIDRLTREFTAGNHGAPIQRINNFVQGATDETPGRLLWSITVAYERMEQAMEELDVARVPNPVEHDAAEIAKAERQLLHEVETVDALVASHPALSADTAYHREFAAKAD